MNSRFRLLAFLLGCTLWTRAGEAAPLPAGKGAGPRFEPIAAVELVVPDRAAVDALAAAGYDVDAVAGRRVRLFADPDELAALRSLGYPLETIRPPAAELPAPAGLGSYNSYAEVTALLQSYAASNPAVARLVSIGQSVQNRELWAMKITSNPDVEADKPRFKYVGSIHGNETLGKEMCLYFIDRLLGDYRTNDPRIVSLVEGVEIWVLPLMNPDGLANNARYNANGYDLNRSFPEGAATNFGNVLYGPPMATSNRQPEVAHVMAWSMAHRFTLSANFHTGAQVVNYPYDNDTLGSVFSPSPDEALFVAMSLAYASNNLPMWNSSYFTHGIVNGAEWYVLYGGMQDWNYRYLGNNEVTIELSDDFQPPSSELPTLWADNRESMLQYLEWVQRGVRGVVTDAGSGQPVQAAVRVEGRHHLVFSSAAVGDYHRLLLPGTYTLWCQAPGYLPQRIPLVVVSNGPATRIDVALQPDSPRFAARINFQPPAAPLPAGHLADTGAVFGLRTGGLSYGWDVSRTGQVRARWAGRSQDLRYDTGFTMPPGSNVAWEIAVPNGPYAVLAALGDAAVSGGRTYQLTAEDAVLLAGTPTPDQRWLEALGTVTVTDGRLTLRNGSGAISNVLAFVELSALDPISIEQWRALHFGATSGVGEAADSADADGDGVVNLQEYADGTAPTNAGSVARLTASLDAAAVPPVLRAVFSRNTNAHDVSFHVEGACDLASPAWLGVASNLAGAGCAGAPVMETLEEPGRVRVVAEDAVLGDGYTNRFLRVRVTRP